MKPYILPDLDYDYGALEPHYSARTLEFTTTSTTRPTSTASTRHSKSSSGAREVDDLSAIVGLEKTLRSTFPDTYCTHCSGRTSRPAAPTTPAASSEPQSTNTSVRSMRSTVLLSPLTFQLRIVKRSQCSE